MASAILRTKVLGPHGDPHVHFRDGNERDKFTLAEGRALMESQGIKFVCDMPNKKPPIISAGDVERWLDLARQAGFSRGSYFVIVGLTENPKQQIEAAELALGHPGVAAAKVYLGSSVGDLKVVELEQQRALFRNIADYKIVVMMHCEKQSMFKQDAFDPRRPYTWNIARPPSAEITSIAEMIALAREIGVKFHVHVCHISTPEGVKLVDKARPHLSISCGATPHHLRKSTADMQNPWDTNKKVNPPLRTPEMAREMLLLLRKHMIDMMESDNAPHRPEEQSFDPAKKPGEYISGIRSMEDYLPTLEWLLANGITEQQIREITWDNVLRVFWKVRKALAVSPRRVADATQL